MKTIISLFLLILCLAGGNAHAQDSLQVAPRQVAQTVLEKLDHELTLTTRQKEQVRRLLMERSERFSKIQKDGGRRKLAKADFREANELALRKLELVLTPDQTERLRALRQESQRQKAAYREEELYKTLQDIELDF